MASVDFRPHPEPPPAHFPQGAVEGFHPLLEITRPIPAVPDTAFGTKDTELKKIDSN